jgi:hypothetical protein
MNPVAEGKRLTLEGTVVNGVIVWDSGTQLPQGERAREEVTTPDDHSPRAEPYDIAAELAIVREALAEAQAGRETPAREVLKERAAQLNVPCAPDE